MAGKTLEAHACTLGTLLLLIIAGTPGSVQLTMSALAAIALLPWAAPGAATAGSKKRKRRGGIYDSTLGAFLGFWDLIYRGVQESLRDV